MDQERQQPTATFGIRLVVDMGQRPRARQLARYLGDLDQLWVAALRGEVGWGVRQIPDGLAVIRIRMESPLETVISSAADLTPFGYAAAAWLGFERAIKLLMDWQNHREDLRDRRARSEGAHDIIAASGQVDGRQAHMALEGLAEHRILRAERSVQGREESSETDD